jgi:hypothetical protein
MQIRHVRDNTPRTRPPVLDVELDSTASTGEAVL